MDYSDYNSDDSNASASSNDEDHREKREKPPRTDFTLKSWRTDFVLIVEGTKLHVAKNILSIASPVFDRMFESSFKESTSDTLELPGKKLDDVVEFLHCIYPNSCTQVTLENASIILPLVEEYQVLPLKEKCEDIMMSHIHASTPAEEIFQYLKDACFYDLKDLREKCIDLAAEKSDEELDTASEECPLPPVAAKELLEKINKRLREDISYLETCNMDYSDQMREETDSLKRKVDDLEQDQSIMEQYLLAEMRRTKEIKLDNENNWKGRHVVLEVDILDRNKKAEREVSIWNTLLNVSAQMFVDPRSREEKLKISVENVGLYIACTVNVRVILVNRQPRGQNLSLIFNPLNFSIYPTLRQKVSLLAKSKDEIRNDESGLLKDNKVGVIVQVYMTQPSSERNDF